VLLQHNMARGGVFSILKRCARIDGRRRRRKRRLEGAVRLIGVVALPVP
jgi:hypothetical protein